MMRRLVLILSYAITAGGCYAYVPLETSATPTVGERVRVALTREGTTELARYLGPRVAEAEGALVSIDADRSMVIAVDFVGMTDGVRQGWSGEGTVTFPANYVAGTQQRTFRKRRSIVASAALAGALIVTAVVALKGGGAAGGPGNGAPPPP